MPKKGQNSYSVRDPGAADRLSGLVERVTFHSGETGFCVLKVKVRGFRDLCAVVGTVPSVSAGEWLTAEGRWVVDSKHGRQFKADTLRVTRPDTEEGIRRYLASGLIKGIGPELAARLVERFGKRVFDVIEKEPARLIEVEGIGAGRRKIITEAFKTQKVVREIMIFLHGHGVSSSRAFRIYKTYGEEAIEKVQADPYRLARDIRGIGFKTADRIAMRLGIDPHSDLRARAGVEYVLQDLTDQGHCACERGSLVSKTASMLDMPVEIVGAAVGHGVEHERLVLRPGPQGGELVYLAPIDYAERRLAADLAALAAGRHPCPPIDADKAAAWVEGRLRMHLAPAQREALVQSFRSKVMVITGGPGVGKTTLVNAIIRVFRAKRLRVVLCAPTGRAAKRLSETSGLEAKTVHRLLAFDPATGGFRHGADRPLGGDVFVVDETSMMDVVLSHQLIRAIPKRAALVLVGDVDQLPSVGPGCVLRDVIRSGAVPVVRLTEVFRQAARSAIVRNAHRVNRGLSPELPVAPGEQEATDFYFVPADEPEDGVAKVVKLVREAIPRRFGLDPVEDLQVLTPMQRGELGARNLNVVLQEALNPSAVGVQRFGWTFRAGDKVMQTVNDYDKDVFNGDIGRIAAVDGEARSLTVRFEGREVPYDFGELDELMLSYATTIHKSQGSEYPAVVIPIHTQHYVMLQRNLLYTAITRARKLVVLVGARRALAMAAKRVSSRQRVTTLKERLVEAMAGGRS